MWEEDVAPAMIVGMDLEVALIEKTLIETRRRRASPANGAADRAKQAAGAADRRRRGSVALWVGECDVLGVVNRWFGRWVYLARLTNDFHT